MDLNENDSPRLKVTPNINQDFIWASDSSILVELFEQVEIVPPNRIVGRDATLVELPPNMLKNDHPK
jgi:hypothetical protein